ncbi:MAG: hydroxymethylbilane synthase [Verrucomicrobia bacterium]|nr:hydroxymethylbilane synthase [Verrucomicrobiota bacterium]MBS0636290.1 hydroxymethylbilane synthase [Verrucomicrobiota bacterium]
MNLCVKVAARSSNLSQKQVWEVLRELQAFHPHVTFEPVFLKTTGDHDLKTSLRNMDASDFFTKEIDDLVLTGVVQVGLHSAKDLPNPLPDGLSMAALTVGLDPSDSLVMSPTFTGKGKIATSSIRREETIRALYPEAECVDIRGTIEQRVGYIERGEIEGLVVAECALVRLGLTSLTRKRLPEPYAKHQGQLAVIARKDDHEMHALFSCIDSRAFNDKNDVTIGTIKNR